MKEYSKGESKKDLGEKKGINVDYNQKHCKHTSDKKPYPKKRRFKKISKKINVESIPGSN